MQLKIKHAFGTIDINLEVIELQTKGYEKFRVLSSTGNTLNHIAGLCPKGESINRFKQTVKKYLYKPTFEIS